MAKRLTAAFVRSAKPGRYYDEHGLMLRVLPTGARQWVWRGTVRGKRVDLGLGGHPYTTLAEARETAFEYRKLARAGGDPRASAAAAPTFEDALEEVLAIQRPSWRPGGRSEAQWRASLRTYALPRLGEMPVDRITTADVLAVLVPIWSTKRETARRVRQRIGAVMKWAVANGYRADNPAGDAIAAALPQGGVRRKHFRALPHAEVAAAVEAVRKSSAGISTRLALEFLVLTAVRSGEVRGARWDEIDVEAATWTIPGERTKSGREHRVPLSRRVLDVLRSAEGVGDGSGLVFPSATGGVIASTTLAKAVRDLDLDCVPHGFRTSFRVWCGDTGVEILTLVAEAAKGSFVRSEDVRIREVAEQVFEVQDTWHYWVEKSKEKSQEGWFAWHVVWMMVLRLQEKGDPEQLLTKRPLRKWMARFLENPVSARARGSPKGAKDALHRVAVLGVYALLEADLCDLTGKKKGGGRSCCELVARELDVGWRTVYLAWRAHGKRLAACVDEMIALLHNPESGSDRNDTALRALMHAAKVRKVATNWVVKAWRKEGKLAKYYADVEFGYRMKVSRDDGHFSIHGIHWCRPRK